MAASPVRFRTEPDKESHGPDRVLIFGHDFQKLAAMIEHLPHAQVTQIRDQETLTPAEMERCNPDVVVCTGKDFRALLLRCSASAAKPALALSKRDRPRLTRLQQELLTFVVKGLSNREIAGVMNRSERVVKSGVSTLLALFDASNRTELATIVAESGIIEPGQE